MSAHPPGPVAALAVRMIGAQPPQDSGSMQEIVHQGVDRHQRRTDLDATAAVAFRRSAARTTTPSPRPCQKRHRRCAADR